MSQIVKEVFEWKGIPVTEEEAVLVSAQLCGFRGLRSDLAGVSLGDADIALSYHLPEVLK